MKILPVDAKQFHADGRTGARMDDRHEEANSRFSKLCECAQKWIWEQNPLVQCR